MLRKLLKNKKAQNTAEYAILISLVVAGIIAMQTYAQRALQARVRDASLFLKNETRGLGSTTQYEPYYLDTAYIVNREEATTQLLTNVASNFIVDSTRTRGTGGRQLATYNATGLANGI